jgi:hypothetical protein
MKNKQTGSGMRTAAMEIQPRTITPFQGMTMTREMSGMGWFPGLSSLFGNGLRPAGGDGFGTPTNGIIPFVGFEGQGVKKNISRAVKRAL